MTWLTYLISFTVQYCFLFHFVYIGFVSLIWFLRIWVANYVYGTMVNWTSSIKKLMQTYIVIVSGSILNVPTVHLNSIWHSKWRYLTKPVLGRHPVLSGHYSIPRGCPLNTGFTVTGKIYLLLRAWILRMWSEWCHRWPSVSSCIFVLFTYSLFLFLPNLGKSETFSISDCDSFSASFKTRSTTDLNLETFNLFSWLWMDATCFP